MSTFYEIEEQLQALLDTEEMVGQEQAGEYFADLARAHTDAIRKRDGIIKALVSFDEQIEGAEEEIKRLKEHIARQQAAKERLQRYVVAVLEMLPEGRQRLTCHLGTLALRKGSKRVEVHDTSQVPWALKRAVVHVAGIQAERIVASLTDGAFASVEPDKKLIRAVIDGGGEVPGVELVTGEPTLKVT